MTPLETIARKAAAGFVKDTRSERSLALGLLRSWHEAEIRGIKRVNGDDIVLTAVRKEYMEACEALGGVL